MRELFRSEDVLVRYVGGFNSKSVVVSFDCYNHGRTLDRKGFGEDFFIRFCIDTIHIITRENHWYLHPEMSEALDVIATVTAGYARVMTYGASMGAYAALRFGARIHAEAAFAIAPQFSISPAVCPFEQRWAAEKQVIRFDLEEEKINPIPEAFVFYDPFHPLDRRHIEKIAEQIPLKEVCLPYAGHSAAVFLSELSMLRESVMAVLDGTFSHQEAAQAAWVRRRETGKYYSTMAKKAARLKHLPWAVSIAKLAHLTNPSNAMYRRIAANLIEESGDIGDAAYWMRGALAADPEATHYALDLARLLLKTNASPEVEGICWDVLKNNPQTPVAWYYLADCLLRQGRAQEALDCAMRARDGEPTHRPYQDRVLECERHLKPMTVTAVSACDVSRHIPWYRRAFARLPITRS